MLRKFMIQRILLTLNIFIAFSLVISTGTEGHGSFGQLPSEKSQGQDKERSSGSQKGLKEEPSSPQQPKVDFQSEHTHAPNIPEDFPKEQQSNIPLSNDPHDPSEQLPENIYQQIPFTDEQQVTADSGLEKESNIEEIEQFQQYDPLSHQEPASFDQPKSNARDHEQNQYAESPIKENTEPPLEKKEPGVHQSVLMGSSSNVDGAFGDESAGNTGREDTVNYEEEKSEERVRDADSPSVTEPEPKQMTEEEIEAEELYQAGEKLINTTYYKEYKEAYLYFLKAAALNHTKAKEYVAFGALFGDYLPQNITLSAEIFEELASKGMPRAQMGLAFMYSAGFNYNSSQAKALIYSTFGALGGDPLSQMALGYRYYAGIGVESKCETALTYYRKVASKVAVGVTFAGGPVVQRVRLQEEAENQGNNSPLLDDDLLQYYHFLADKGDQQAQIVLGTLYYQGGKGVIINHEQAYHYFSTAAESGNGHALGYLGKMHSEGSPFVVQNNHTAFEYFKMSAEKTNHIGQAGLGMMYLNGYGVDKDTNKAFHYFSLASEQGSVDGQLQLGIMYFSGNGVRKDYKMAVKYFTLASQNGHVLAFYNLAQMHATGTGVLRNCHTAVELFKNVAERGRWSEMMMDAHRMYQAGDRETSLIKYMFLAELGYEVAQSNVAYMLDSNLCNSFDKHETYQRALLQYSRAAVQGSTHARLKIGDYHYYGYGTEIDYDSAASHYRMASEQQRSAQAMFNLGYMHERGLGLKQDVHLAKRFYDMAAETSVDAHIPVTLALLKLGLFYGVDVFSKEFDGLSGIIGVLDPANYLGVAWDIYLACFMALCFTILFYRWRVR